MKINFFSIFDFNKIFNSQTCCHFVILLIKVCYGDEIYKAGLFSLLTYFLPLPILHCRLIIPRERKNGQPPSIPPLNKSVMEPAELLIVIGPMKELRHTISIVLR